MPDQGHLGPLLAYIQLGHWKLHIRLQNPPTNHDPNYYQNQDENKTCKVPIINAFLMEAGAIKGAEGSLQQPTKTMTNNTPKVRQPLGPDNKAIKEVKQPPESANKAHEEDKQLLEPTNKALKREEHQQRSRAQGEPALKIDGPEKPPWLQANNATRTNTVHPTGPGPPYRSNTQPKCKKLITFSGDNNPRGRNDMMTKVNLTAGNNYEDAHDDDDDLEVTTGPHLTNTPKEPD